MSLRSIFRRSLYALFLAPPVIVAAIAFAAEEQGDASADRIGQQRVLVPSRNADQPDEEPRGPRIPLQLPTGNFATAVPIGVETDSYVELAAFATKTGQQIRVFAGKAAPGTAAADGSDCVGIRSERFVTLSCGERYPDVAFHAHQSTYLGETFVSGVVRPTVQRLLLVDDRGAARDVTTKNGAFFHEGSGTRLIAFGRTNQILAERALPPQR